MYNRSYDRRHCGNSLFDWMSLKLENFSRKSFKTIESICVDLKDKCGRKSRLGVIYRLSRRSQETFEELANLLFKVISDSAPCITASDFNFLKFNGQLTTAADKNFFNDFLNCSGTHKYVDYE